MCMTELMVMLVDESESLSEDVIEMTLGQIQKVNSYEWFGSMYADMIYNR